MKTKFSKPYVPLWPVRRDGSFWPMIDSYKNRPVWKRPYGPLEARIFPFLSRSKAKAKNIDIDTSDIAGYLRVARNYRHAGRHKGHYLFPIYTII